MAYTGNITRKQRLVSAAIALIVTTAIGIGLATGLDLTAVRQTSEIVHAIAISNSRQSVDEPPSPAEVDDRPPAEASAPDRESVAAPIVAAKPKIKSPKLPRVIAAISPRQGADSDTGSSQADGPGSGAGGQGDGMGSGGSGDGTGGGSKAIWRSGRIYDRDYPREASRARASGIVEAHFTINRDGRVSDCRVTRSSGEPALDAVTCRLIEQRFRFKPATDATGNPVASKSGWRQSWWLERRN